MAEVQRQPAPCSRDWKIQVKNLRGSEWERFTCDFEAFLDISIPQIGSVSIYLPVSRKAGMAWVGRDHAVLDTSD